VAVGIVELNAVVYGVEIGKNGFLAGKAGRARQLLSASKGARPFLAYRNASSHGKARGIPVAFQRHSSMISRHQRNHGRIFRTAGASHQMQNNKIISDSGETIWMSAYGSVFL